MTLRAAAPALAALFIAGCSGGGGIGALSGKVTYQGKPVIYGVVVVRLADGTQRTVNIEPDGSYTAPDLPPGVVKLGVQSPEPPDPSAQKPRSRGSAPAPAAPRPTVDRSKWFQIPDQLADPDKSGISTTVKAGANSFDIQLQ
jgi:hypothetical protein